MKKTGSLLLKLVVAVAFLALVGCEGWGGKVACKRLPDGTVECVAEAHRDGKHQE